MAKRTHGAAQGGRLQTLTKTLKEAGVTFVDEPLPGEKPTRSAKSASEAGVSALEERLPQVVVDGEVLWRVEGDLLLDADQLFLYSQQQAGLQAQRQLVQLADQAGFGEVPLSGGSLVDRSALVGIVQGGKIVRWSPSTILTYCVLENTFPRTDWYEEAVRNMEEATSDWINTCGVAFEYRDDLDGSDTLRPDVVFPVRHISAGGAFIAAAFFPNDPVKRWRLLIDPSYFSTTFDHVGVLRHELGHVLGFRHEHIRSLAPAICPDEDLTGTFDLTSYDPQSVMHYFCGDVGSRQLAISDIDRVGSQRVYGPPLETFEFLEA
jgi:hypothetical protein